MLLEEKMWFARFQQWDRFLLNRDARCHRITSTRHSHMHCISGVCVELWQQMPAAIGLPPHVTHTHALHKWCMCGAAATDARCHRIYLHTSLPHMHCISGVCVELRSYLMNIVGRLRCGALLWRQHIQHTSSVTTKSSGT